jgi:hypothetical protein
MLEQDGKRFRMSLGRPSFLRKGHGVTFADLFTRPVGAAAEPIRATS